MSENNNSNLKNIISNSNNSVTIRIKVSPGSSKTKIVGIYGDAIKVALSAPPEKGKANQALIKLMEKTLGISKQQINIISGQTSKLKVIEIRNIDLSDCLTKLNNILQS